MTKPVSTTKKPRKQHTPEFRQEVLKLAERIGVAAAVRELNLYESPLYAWRSKLKNAHSSSVRKQEMAVEIARLKRQLAEQAEELAIIQQRHAEINSRQQIRLICDSAVFEAFHRAKQRYGVPRLTGEPHAQGYRFNVKTVAASLLVRDCGRKLH